MASSTSFTIPPASRRPSMIFEKVRRSRSIWDKGQKGRGARTSGSPERVPVGGAGEVASHGAHGAGPFSYRAAYHHHEWKSAPHRNPATSASKKETGEAARAAG